MSSRLDRLFLLLDNGGSSITRKAAAQQLGDVVKQHPSELKPLLERLHSYIVSKSWDTRIAAGQAVEALAANLQLWNPPNVQTVEELEDMEELQIHVGRLSLSSFSIFQVLKHGTYLLSMDDDAFSNNVENNSNPTEKLCDQRRLVNQRLGLDVAEAIGLDTQHLFSNEDLVDQSKPCHEVSAEPSKGNLVDLVNSELSSSGSSLSSRELNRAKRKARMLSKQKSMDITTDNINEEGPSRKKLKSFSSLQETTEQCFEENKSKEDAEWPFSSFCDVLTTDMFSCEWETRHGAATALREIIKVHGEGAGIVAHHTKDQRVSSHEEYLGDLSVRVCCVLAMDRFGDFITDQVVAPVRETCAQLLGLVLQKMSESSILSVLKILEEMLSWDDWETRHGGLLGMKYILAVCDVDREKLIARSYDYIFKGLTDDVDDVVAEAASCLVPISDDLIKYLPAEKLVELVSTLWDSLLDIDDLTASTNSILLLLSKMISHPNSNKITRNCLSSFVCRLWPFFYHNNVSVRRSSLKTLAILTAQPVIELSKCDTISSSNNLTSDSLDIKMEASNNLTNDSLDIKMEASNNLTNDSLDIKMEASNNLTSNSLDIKMEASSKLPSDSLNLKLEAGSKLSSDSLNLKQKEEASSKLSSDSLNLKVDAGSKLPNDSLNVKMETDTQGSLENCDSTNEQNSSDSLTIENDVHVNMNENSDVLKNAKDNALNGTTLSASVDSEEKIWLSNILQALLIHIYQRSLLESSSNSLDLVITIWMQILQIVPLSDLLLAVCPKIANWLCFLMVSNKQSLDSQSLLIAHHTSSNSSLKKHSSLTDHATENRMDTKYYFGGLSSSGEVQDKMDIVIKCKLTAAKLLGYLSHYITKPMPGVAYSETDQPITCYTNLLTCYLSSRSALQRIGAGIVVREWASQWPQTDCPPVLKEALHRCLTEIVYYDEIAISFTRLQQDVKDFIALMKHYKLEVKEIFSSAVLTLEQIECLSKVEAPLLFNTIKLRQKVFDNLEGRRRAILSSVTQTSADQQNLLISTQAILAGACIWFKILPEKLNPVIKPLMDSIKKEKTEQFQLKSANDLTYLLKLCINRDPSPNSKILKNLANFLCIDKEYTPHIEDQTDANKFTEIYTVSLINKMTEKKTNKDASKIIYYKSNATDERDELTAEHTIQRRGCITAFKTIAEYFGKTIPEELPHLWHLTISPITKVPEIHSNPDVESQELVNWLQLLEVLIPVLHQDLVIKIIALLSKLETWLYHKYSAVRHMTSRVMAELSSVDPVTVISHVVANILPLFNHIDNDHERQGAVECINCIIDKLGFRIVPYIVLLIVPLLGRNGDPNKCIRLLSTRCFASLLRLLPLEGGVPDPPTLNVYLIEKKQEERLFLDQLMSLNKTETYDIPIPIKAELRSYQQEGVNWLAFLSRYQLHGILCDDMGLGKTLQSICILAGEHYKLGVKGNRKMQSLVICPPTLTGHWVYEIQKFVSGKYLNPLHYTGTPPERIKLRQFFPHHNLIVASYDIVRNEIDYFSTIRWNYVVLDEGHIIKNGKTKSSKAIKQLIANHRLILTGTPIQNNVLELWSLFDFLIPGFLGTEKQFIAQYSKPILQSRDPKSTSQEQEAGVLAMESLHRQVLPFILRRIKADVLKDLPPKITQDYYCELSPLQKQLYEDFARSRAKRSIDNTIGHTEIFEETAAPIKPQTHIFQALQYLRRVCNHPKLVVNPQHPEYNKIVCQMKEQNTSFDDIHHSAKLPALKQLLLDCGIGVTSDMPSVMSQHRALIFCQLKGMLDIIEKDLLKKHLPSVTYMRLDGSVPAGSRHSLVQKFNSDPSIDLFLLTTQVGGLGLNLTGADTVIFVEHDWNPMRDLQAMDRAHRIGQKKVVNVYRLITSNTLEEKIMSLQKFKMMTANTVISQENASMFSMETDKLLDLFVLDSGRREDQNSQSDVSDSLLGMKGSGVKSVLETLPDLWDESQYESEYNLSNFMSSLKK